MNPSTCKFLKKCLRTSINRLANLFDKPIVILLYHRITILKTDPQLLAVHPKNFRNQVIWLKQNFPIARLEDDWKQVRKPAVVITFDDGYADNVLEALPILEDAHVPATFFVTSGNINTQAEYWWDELERIIFENEDVGPSFELQDKQFGGAWATGTHYQKQVLYEDMHVLMKKVNAARREKWMEQLRNWAKVDQVGRPSHRPMTVEELRVFADSPWVTIGAHTVTHTPLSVLPIYEQRKEIVDSKFELEEWIGKEVTVFSYPFGGKGDYTKETVQLCKEVGLIKAVSNFPGQAHKWTNPHQLPRQIVRNWPIEVFAKEIKRAFITGFCC